MKTGMKNLIVEGVLALIFLTTCAIFGFLAYHAGNMKELVMYVVVYAGCLCIGASAARSFAEILLKRNHREQEVHSQSNGGRIK
ncbi:MAG: hypothetical protein V1928_05285 [Parcubacteria group bacterium]